MTNPYKSGLDQIEPLRLWHHFGALTEIPRPSKGEDQVLRHIGRWASGNGYAFRQDGAGNLCVSVPASPGRGKAPTVALQAHVDMVCVRDSASLFDPAAGRIRVFLEDDWVKSDGTTLGADNGVGVAAMLAVGEPGSCDHGPLELLFTVDEETGLTGATQLDPSLLTSRMLLNLDSEDDRAFFVGAAGGQQITFWMAGRRPLKSSEKWAGLVADVHGLNGGHSGTDIGKGHMNAIQAVARMLRPAAEGGRLALRSIKGGSQTNVIPSDCRAEILFPSEAEAPVRAALIASLEELREQYRDIEKDWTCELLTATPEQVIDAFDPAATERLLDFVLAMPSGVLAMSQQFPGLVETSMNLGVIGLVDDEVKAAVRSNKAGGLREAFGKLQALGHMAGVRSQESTAFPPWTANQASRLMAVCSEAYRRAVKQEPVAMTVHAGLECSLIGAKVSDLDMVSFGPLIVDPHTTKERVSVSSVARFWIVLKAILDDLSK